MVVTATHGGVGDQHRVAGVPVSVGVGVAVGVGVQVLVEVCVTVALGEAVAVGEEVDVGVGVDCGAMTAVGEGDGEGMAAPPVSRRMNTLNFGPVGGGVP